MNDKVKEVIALIREEHINATVQKEILETKSKTQMMVLDKSELYNISIKVEGLNKYLNFLENTASAYGKYAIRNAMINNDLETELYVYYELFKYSIKEIALIKSLSEDKIKETLKIGE